MLQIKDICKEYRTGSYVHQALDHVSLTLRDNEFVAILGPSGSGKTTLLNIIGGLDRYDSGDLVINGVSTKKYKDRDWDSYRNHSIGFVFQSYNLITHQSILANVELALTIGGISGKERERRATEALVKVGLGDQIHKKPTQMSGGQMQRVAIARALVNDPDILLADEPTGALDSETSIQVMDLLKEVAEDRLVVMVTHNPELAEQYATRIVKLKDGKITGDSNPVSDLDEQADVPVHKNMGKASMSFLTALSLSFNNLKTKFGRTLLIAFAGSIGIIGIALILSFSNGVNNYIQNIQEDTLLEYPLEIQSSSYSLSSLMAGNGSDPDAGQDEADVTEHRVASGLFSGVSSNDLAALKHYFESEDCGIGEYAKTIEYTYDITPLIYRMEGQKYYQVNPNQTMSLLGFNSGSSSNLFQPLPASEKLYMDSYELKAGHWPENNNEAVLVISEDQKISDLALYTLGLKDMSELEDMLSKVASREEIEESAEPLSKYSYDDFIGITFKNVNSSDRYEYDEEYKVWKSKAEDEAYMRSLISRSEDLVIVGVVMQKDGVSGASLSAGMIYYPWGMTMREMEYAAGSRIVREQLGSPSVNVFTGSPFNETRDDSTLNLETLFSVDEEALNRVFSFDSSKLNMDSSAFSNLDLSSLNLSNIIDPDALSQSLSSVSVEDLREALSEISVEVNSEELSAMFRDIMTGYTEYAAQSADTDYTRLPEAIQEYLASQEAKDLIRSDLTELITEKQIDQITEEQARALVVAVMSGYQGYVADNGLDPAEFDANMAAYLQTDEARALLSAQIEQIVAAFSEVDISEEDIEHIISDISNGYTAFAEAHQYPTTARIMQSFTEYLQSEEGRQKISDGIEKSVNTEELSRQLTEVMSGMAGEIGNSLSGLIGQAMTDVFSQMTGMLTSGMQRSMEQLVDSMNDAFSIHPEEFANAISMNMDEQQLQELLSSLMNREQASYDGNLRTLGFGEEQKPYTIAIYPKDFEGKEHIVEILDSYNEDMRASGQEDKVISYTDRVSLLMSSVTSMVDAISYVLIAFVAISLFVSSIMIGVITYISVLERRKEIGILRSIGASKRNVSSVFNAETFIIGLLAGALGVGITLLLLIPANMILRHATGTDIAAALPASSGAILIVFSVILTMLGGLIPSSKAAKSDPVTALRSE